MPIYDFKCRVCGSKKKYTMFVDERLEALSEFEKNHLSCCSVYMDRQERDLTEEIGLEEKSYASITIQGAYHKEKTQKMLVERAKKYEKQEKEHKASVINRKVFGMQS